MTYRLCNEAVAGDTKQNFKRCFQTSREGGVGGGSKYQLESPDGASLFLLPAFPRDRLRTTTNVLGDSLGAGIVEHLSRHELKNPDVEMGNSVIEENEMKKPYQLIAQESDTEKPIDSETKM